MGIYSISDLEKLSGIKAHTIRIWEKRYDLIQPERTPTNIRYYKDKDLRLLLNIAILKKNGFRISEIASMTEKEIEERARSISLNGQKDKSQLDGLTLSMVDLDEAKFDHIINESIESSGFEKTMLEVIYPLLDKLSLLWITGAIKAVQENFMSYVIRQKIIVAIDKEKTIVDKSRKKFLLFLPEGEKQELSLLFMHYLIKQRKFRAICLGQEVKFIDVQDAWAIHKPDYIFTMINEELQRMSFEEYVQDLASEFEESEILISGYQVVSNDIVPPKNVHLLSGLDDTIKCLDEIDMSATTD